MNNDRKSKPTAFVRAFVPWFAVLAASTVAQAQDGADKAGAKSLSEYHILASANCEHRMAASACIADALYGIGCFGLLASGALAWPRAYGADIRIGSKDERIVNTQISRADRWTGEPSVAASPDGKASSSRGWEAPGKGTSRAAWPIPPMGAARGARQPPCLITLRKMSLRTCRWSSTAAGQPT